MSRLLVLTTPRAGGAATGSPGSPRSRSRRPPRPRTRLEELLAREDGVIAVHAPYFYALGRPLRQRLDALRAPLVVPLPAGDRR